MKVMLIKTLTNQPVHQSGVNLAVFDRAFDCSRDFKVEAHVLRFPPGTRCLLPVEPSKIGAFVALLDTHEIGLLLSIVERLIICVPTLFFEG